MSEVKGNKQTLRFVDSRSDPTIGSAEWRSLPAFEVNFDKSQEVWVSVIRVHLTNKVGEDANSKNCIEVRLIPNKKSKNGSDHRELLKTLRGSAKFAKAACGFIKAVVEEKKPVK